MRIMNKLKLFLVVFLLMECSLTCFAGMSNSTRGNATVEDLMMAIKARGGQIKAEDLQFIEFIQVKMNREERERVQRQMEALASRDLHEVVAFCMASENRIISMDAAELLSTHIDPSLKPYYLKVLNNKILPSLRVVSGGGQRIDEYRREILDKLYIYSGKEIPDNRSFDELVKFSEESGDFSWYRDMYFTDYAKIQSFANEVNAIENSHTVTSEISSTSPVEEVIEEVTAPEQAIKEPTEVVDTEPIEGDVEQSSNWPAWLENWWLWLVGPVVVIGGILKVRRKK